MQQNVKKKPSKNTGPGQWLEESNTSFLQGGPERRGNIRKRKERLALRGRPATVITAFFF
jgi:hypothetical protein